MDNRLFDNRPFEKNIEEMSRTYRPVIAELFHQLEKEIIGWPLVGSSSDETLRSAYRKQFSLDALAMFKSKMNFEE